MLEAAPIGRARQRRSTLLLRLVCDDLASTAAARGRSKGSGRRAIGVLQFDGNPESRSRGPGGGACGRCQGRDALGEQDKLLGVLHDDELRRVRAEAQRRLDMLIDHVARTGLSVELQVHRQPALLTPSRVSILSNMR